MKFWRRSRALSSPSSRALAITCRGKPIGRDELYKYTNGRFLIREKDAYDRRYLRFDIDQLCAIAASTGSKSPVHTVEKMEGGFSKALLMKKEDGTEVIAKLPFPIAGPPKYTTAAEVAVLQYVHQHTKVPVPRVLAWSSNSSNPVGAEYIIMEKAAGSQLVKKWGEMEDYSHFMLIKNLCEIEAELAAVRFPASGSLYLRESMGNSDRFEPLETDIDPSGRFCIGPSCGLTWFSEDNARFNKGPWPSLPTFGIALVDREISRIEQTPKTTMPHTPSQGSIEEKIAILRLAKEVISRMDPQTLPGRFSWPILWHTDLHLGNIYVSDEDPTQIVSIIDWQSISVSPLFYQVRFPEFLDISEDYELGNEVPKLPENIDQMDADDQEIARFEHKQASMAKAYEAASGFKNKNIYKALQLPPYFQELFIRCGEVWEEGIVPLRACLITISEVWKEAGFTGDCPIKFSKDDIEKHEREFEDYSEYHKIQGLARKYLGTDVEGWISPYIDFEIKRQQNKELMELVMANSTDYGKTAEEVQKIWPF